jgi:hypothetical protein
MRADAVRNSADQGGDVDGRAVKGDLSIFEILTG